MNNDIELDFGSGSDFDDVEVNYESDSDFDDVEVDFGSDPSLADVELIFGSDCNLSAETAEAYAVGQRKGVDVEESDPTYHNNAKYYAEQASDSANAARTEVAKIKALSVDSEIVTSEEESQPSVYETDDHLHIHFRLLKGEKGDKGDSFKITKTFPSISDMLEYDGDDVVDGDYVIISGALDDVNNGKLFVKTDMGYQFVVSMSGASSADGKLDRPDEDGTAGNVLIPGENGEGTRWARPDYDWLVNKPRIPNYKYGTTDYWNSQLYFIPEEGEVIVYSDHGTIEENGETIVVPGVTIGDGNAYCIDLPFVSDDLAMRLTNHINNQTIHVSSNDRISWDNKVDIALTGETLQFIRE